jgi:hypothetical protein
MYRLLDGLRRLFRLFRLFSRIGIHFVPFSILERLAEDVETADEFVDILSDQAVRERLKKLNDWPSKSGTVFSYVLADLLELSVPITWPVIELLESLAHSLITQDVKPRELDPLFAQQADRLSRESTFRRRWVALHEQHDLVQHTTSDSATLHDNAIPCCADSADRARQRNRGTTRRTMQAVDEQAQGIGAVGAAGDCVVVESG